MTTITDNPQSQCREVYRAGGGKDSGKGYEAWRVDEEKPEGILGKFAASPLLEPNASNVVDRGVRAISLASDVAEDTRDSSSRSSMGFMISAGADRKIRYWNLAHIEASCVVSGLDIDELKPTFTQSQLTTTLTFNAEKAATQGGERGGNGGSPAGSVGRAAGKRGSRASSGSGGSGGNGGSGGGRPPRSTVISMQQQQLMRSHLDSILDVSFSPSFFSRESCRSDSGL